MEKRAEIVIKGRVQKAGYRDYIDEVAFNAGINGWVKNLEDGTVKIVCEGTRKNIEGFIKTINIHEYPIRVDDVIVEYFPSNGEFKDFTIIREDDLKQILQSEISELRGEIGELRESITRIERGMAKEAA